MLKYQKIDSGWGLTATFEGKRLVFTGLLKNQRATKKLAEDFDIFTLFSNSARHAWRKAEISAKQRKSAEGTEDLFLALLNEKSVKNLLLRLKVNTTEAEQFLKNYLSLAPNSSVEAVKKIPFEAFDLAMKLHNHKIGSLMLLGALLKSLPKDNILQAIFTNIGLSAAKLELFAVWHLQLNYQFPPETTSSKLLYCLQQASGLEQHFGYFYELPAIETALSLSQGQTFTDLEHKKALSLLVKAGLLAKQKKRKAVSAALVQQAAF